MTGLFNSPGKTIPSGILFFLFLAIAGVAETDTSWPPPEKIATIAQRTNTFSPVFSSRPLPVHRPTCLLDVPSTPTSTATPPAPDLSLDLYGTFHSIGITLRFNGMEDPEENAEAVLEYALETAPWRLGFPLARPGRDQFVGSLFQLKPGRRYHVRVTLSDPEKGPLDGRIVTGSCSTRPEIVIPPPTRSWYVAPNGSDDAPADGSKDCPFATLQRALKEVTPGEEILLREGVYFQGEIQVAVCGGENAPIVIRPHPGETAVLDGSDPTTYTWKNVGGGVYQTTIRTPSAHLVLAMGRRLYPYHRFEDLQSLLWGLPGFYLDGTTLSVRLEKDSDPATSTLVVSRYRYGLDVTGSYCYFTDLTFRHYGVGTNSKAMFLHGGTDNLVTHCRFSLNDVGIGLKYEVHRTVIQDNEFHDDVFEWPWDAVKDGSLLETGGVVFYPPMTGRGTVIRRNKFHDYFDGFTCAPGTSTPLTQETDVYENHVWRCGDDGIGLDGCSSNVRVWGNTIHDILVGISLAPVFDGPTYVFRNVIYLTGAGIHNYPGVPIRLNHDGGPYGPIFLLHNTCDGIRERTYGFATYSPGSWKRLVSRNNIWSGTRFALSYTNPPQPMDFDYDLLHTSWPNSPFYWMGLANPYISSIEQLRQLTGQELHGIYAAPSFQNAAAGDFSPAEGSPLIDTGLRIPGINDVFDGAAPDIGALERIISPPSSPFWICY